MASPFWEATVVAWWGAGLSSILGAVTIYDRFFRKPVPETTYMLAGDAGVGSQIVVINTSPTPLLVKHWSLYYAKPERQLWLRRDYELASPDDLDADVRTIPPHSSWALQFVDGDHFSWGPSMAKRGQLYIELRLAGRIRPIVLHVYNPDPERSSEPWSLRRLVPHQLRPRPLTPTRDPLEDL